MRVQGTPIRMGNRIQCLNIAYQVWFSIVNTTQDFNKFYMLHASVFRGQEINATSSINLPIYEMWVTNKESDWVHWQQCKSEKSQVLLNISHGDAIYWSPCNFPQGKYSHSELKWQWYNSNGAIEMNSTVNEPIWWHGVGIHAILQFGKSVQPNLWKLARALSPLQAWEGKLNIKDDKYTCLLD